MQIDLLTFEAHNRNVVNWPFGRVQALPSQLQELTRFLQSWLQISASHYYLFWDLSLGMPDPALIVQTTKLPGDVWHAGLRLGTAGLPRMLDFVNPVSMFTRDPDKKLAATSWRLSLRACLLKTEVFRQLNSFDSGYETLLAAGLDFGYRCIARGVFIRHIPDLIPASATITINDQSLSIYDELRFILRSFGRPWLLWAMGRAAMHGYSIGGLLEAWKELRQEKLNANPISFKHIWPQVPFDKNDWHEKVTVLIPTLERYPYLRRVLNQLRAQTITPLEIIVVDQTPLEERDLELQVEFNGLPLKVLYLDTPGQCTSRNAGLQISRGDHILFLDDDDDELSPTLIEQHLRALVAWHADVSSGVAEETGAGALPENFTFLRISDVFPTGNTMIRRATLERTGLFDPAFDRGEKEDHDLGMRCYLAGAFMLLNPEIRVLHHHASRGGLRHHRARITTYAASRKSIKKRQLLSSTEIYLVQKYFTAVQLRECLWLSIIGTLAIKGNKFVKLLKIIIGGMMMPHTLWKIRSNWARAKKLDERRRNPRLSSSAPAALEK